VAKKPTNLRVELESLRSFELVEALSTRIYEPPLSRCRECLRHISIPLRVPILVLDFDTELSMNGMLGFLENSTGLYLPETIGAFEIIGARETTEVLRSIETTLQKHGVSPSQLRADFAGTEEYQVTTFRKLHGDLGTMPEEVERDAERLYLYAKQGEPVWDLLAAFVEKNRKDIFAEITRITADL
jgi:hypothetical protein